MTDGVFVRIVARNGSSPRDPGAEMFVSGNSATGTIGGGRLEWDAISLARDILAGKAQPGRRDVALGPEIGQCCGGRVTLEFAPGAARTERVPVVLVFGGGHVGAALGLALAALPVRARVLDTREGYGEQVAIPEAEVRAAPPGSAFVVTTHDHGLDFLIVEEALRRGDAAYVGMIGSATKRKVAERHLRAAGLDPSPLVCPIGAAGKGDKRPGVIALHTAAEIAGAFAR